MAFSLLAFVSFVRVGDLSLDQVLIRATLVGAVFLYDEPGRVCDDLCSLIVVGLSLRFDNLLVGSRNDSDQEVEHHNHDQECCNKEEEVHDVRSLRIGDIFIKFA